MADKVFSEHECRVLERVMRYRRDVRGNHFTAEPVSDMIIDRILDAALRAPSVGFSQPWEFVVIRDPKLKQGVRASFETANQTAKPLFDQGGRSQYAKLKLEGITEAPVNLAVFYRPSDGPVLGQTTVAEVGLYSVVCAVQNMWLMARALNIGMGWVSILDPEEVKRLVNAPKACRLVAYMCLGYVSDFGDTPELEQIGWETRKRRAEVIHKDSFRVERAHAEEC